MLAFAPMAKVHLVTVVSLVGGVLASFR